MHNLSTHKDIDQRAPVRSWPKMKTTKKVATGKHTKHGNTQAFPPKPATPNIPTKEIASKDHMAKEHLIANSKLKNLGGRSIF